MENKVIVSGCSYSYGTTSYGNVLSKRGFDVKLISYPGQGNDSIIYKIYKEINKNNLKNIQFICQLTWLHRLSEYLTVSKKWIDYQPNFINIKPTYDELSDSVEFNHDVNYGTLNTPDYKLLRITKEQYDEMMQMYKTYLKYHYDETESFNHLLYKVDTLQTYINETGNTIKFIYWPNISDDYQLNQLKQRNFVNVGGEYSILKWSTKNKLLDGSSHLSETGHETFAQLVENQLVKKKYQNIC